RERIFASRHISTTIHEPRDACTIAQVNPPTHPLVLRGREAMNRGDVAAASAAAEERLRADPRDTDALELRYLTQQQRGDISKAAETLQAVISIDDTADWAFNDLTSLLHTHGRREDAEKVVRAALRANPANGQAHFHLGTL